MLLSIVLASLLSACPDSLYDSLIRELGTGEALSKTDARSIRNLAIKAADLHPECESSAKLEEIAFDMATIIEQEK